MNELKARAFDILVKSGTFGITHYEDEGYFVVDASDQWCEYKISKKDFELLKDLGVKVL